MVVKTTIRQRGSLNPGDCGDPSASPTRHRDDPATESETDSAATYAEFHTPGYGTPVPSASPPRPVSGFRSEQRFSDPTTVLRIESAEWDAATPPTGMPAVDPFAAPAQYYAPVPAAAPPHCLRRPPVGAPLPPAYRPTVSPTPYPDLSTDGAAAPGQAGRRRAAGARLLYAVSGGLINVGESPTDAHRKNLIAHVNQPAAGLLPDRAAEPEGRRR